MNDATSNAALNPLPSISDLISDAAQAAADAAFYSRVGALALAREAHEIHAALVMVIEGRLAREEAYAHMAVWPKAA